MLPYGNVQSIENKDLIISIFFTQARVQILHVLGKGGLSNCLISKPRSAARQPRVIAIANKLPDFIDTTLIYVYIVKQNYLARSRSAPGEGRNTPYRGYVLLELPHGI